MANNHAKKNDRKRGQRLGRFYSNVSDLFFSRHGCLAYLVHCFIFWLQFTPAAPLFGPTYCTHIPKRTDEHCVCNPLYSQHCYPTFLDLDSLRPRTRKWFNPSTPLFDDLWQHTTRDSGAETNDDRR